jgi:hypothetical protein
VSPGVATRDGGRTASTILAIAAVYVAFLLCAQFGFLAGLESALGRDTTALRAVLSAMGAGGLAGAALAARSARWRGWADRPDRAVRLGLGATAAAAAASVVPTRPVGFALAAVALGGALGFVTVALAGAGTGVAYLVSNLPSLFGGSAAVRALAPAALCLAGR